MHTRLPWALAAACMTLTMSACTQTQSADARLQSIYSDEWKWREQQFADDEDAQKRIEDHLPKVDAQAQAQRLQMWQDVLDRKSVV